MRIKTAAIGRLLLSAERRVALIERCQPTNYRAEFEKLVASNDRKSPSFAYAPAPVLTDLRCQLAEVAGLAERGGWWGVVAARAGELELEAQLAEAVGTPRFATLSRRRFSFGGPWCGVAQQLALDWLAAAARQIAAEPPSQARHQSDDASDASSLLCVTLRTLRRANIDFRVEVRQNMAALAATGNGVILISAGRALSAHEGERVAAHEVLGHALPRANAARDKSSLFLAGTAGGGDDEEGNALLIEEESGLLDARRRFTLALRHCAADALFSGASYCETVALLLGLGSSAEAAHAVATRVYRGGGLGRELVYLPAMQRVRVHRHKDDRVSTLLRRGRVGVSWVEPLLALGEPPIDLEL